MKRYLLAGLLACAGPSALLATGCSGEDKNPLPGNFKPGESAPPAAAAHAEGAAAPANAVSPLQSQIDPAKEDLLAEVRTRKFKNEDFVEADTNRDPFRSFLSDFSGGPIITEKQYPILAPKYSLDELKLSMIVGPGTEGLKGASRIAHDAIGRHVEPAAMFIDPTGMGVKVVRGNHLSKADAKVIRIEPDKSRVYVEIREDLGGGKSRPVERVLELHQGELNTEGNQ
jgi:hypothetical protein